MALGGGISPDGPRVRSLREERGWNQEGLADRALVDVQTLRRIERGERVRRISLLHVAKVLGQTIDQLQAVDQPAPAPTLAPTARLRAAVAADCGGADLLAGVAPQRVRPLREFAVERTLCLSPAAPAESPRALLSGSAAGTAGRWLVVGEAGSGKTTLLQALALELATEERPASCPVVVRLAEMAQGEWSPQAPESLLRGMGQDTELLVDQARRGSLALLLDGLDEVPALRREQVRGLLRVAAAAWPCPIVVTSRPQGLRLPAGFEVATLNPLTDGQVAELLRRWSLDAPATSMPSFAADEWRNPLFLMLVALLRERAAGAAWPASRHELLEQVLALLLEGLHRPESSPRLTDLGLVREALEHLAHGFTTDGLVSASRDELATRLRDATAVWSRLERVPRWSAGPEEFLVEVAERTGLLGQHDGPASPWRFWHRSLQELLTAGHLARRARTGGLDALVATARTLRRGEERSQWVEPFTLLCGALDRPDAVLLALSEADPEVAVRALECARRVEPATLRSLLDAARPLANERPRARTFVEGMRNWWAVVGDSARPGLVKAVEYRVGGWVGADAGGQRLVSELAAALGRERVDPLEVGVALDALARHLPCFRGPLRGSVYLQLARLLPREQARALALELWGASLARGVEVAEDLFFLDELLRRLDGGRAGAGEALYERLARPPRDLVEWRAIPAGAFLMGGRAEEPGFPWERPRHRVSFPAGWQAGATQVTNAQWAAFDPSARVPAGVDRDEWLARPAVDVSWYGAVAFSRWLARGERGSPRLPTEAEWEYMARAGTTTAYWSGDAEADLDRVGWWRGTSGGQLRPVGQKPANPWGLNDVHGNVWEWVQDWYGPYSDEEASAPRGPTSGTCRLLRGGCYAWDAAWARAAHRAWLPPEAQADDVGFRLVRDP
jgi:formylglycine-generating enzyme required for sulfatase activity/transcriptional regulator with XRE-family HTH domain